MIIGIEAQRANNAVKTGVEHYVKQLILHLAKIDHQNQYVLYLQTKPADWFLNLPKNFQIKIMPFPIFWTQLRISWEMLWHPPDVLFVPASTLPFIHPKSVYTEHDVGWVYYPEIFTTYMLWFHRIFSWLARGSAKKIIAISHATKQDLIHHYQISPEKITVIPHGYEVQTNIPAQLSKSIASSLPEKYLLFLSTIQPRKNIVGLISAFRLLKNEHPDLPHKLVVVGKLGWKYEESWQAIKDNSDIVVYLGHIADDERWEVYRRADVYVNASIYEGFGMWILEAFESGVPVVISNVSSMPEVGGDAALYFNPHSISEIKNALWRVLQDPSLAQTLVQKGKARLTMFSWETSAQQTLAVLEEVANKTND